MGAWDSNPHSSLNTTVRDERHEGRAAGIVRRGGPQFGRCPCVLVVPGHRIAWWMAVAVAAGSAQPRRWPPRGRAAPADGAPPTLPEAGDPYSLTGQDPGGAELFSLSFAIAEFTDAEAAPGQGFDVLFSRGIPSAANE